MFSLKMSEGSTYSVIVTGYDCVGYKDSVTIQSITDNNFLCSLPCFSNYLYTLSSTMPGVPDTPVTSATQDGLTTESLHSIPKSTGYSIRRFEWTSSRFQPLPVASYHIAGIYTRPENCKAINQKIAKVDDILGIGDRFARQDDNC
jgi:hypothetical protein